MSFDLQRILESKRAYRQRLAALPIAEKLRMLDALRERALQVRGIRGQLATELTIADEERSSNDAKRP